MTHTLQLRLLLVAYVVLALTYSLVTPLFEASDELWHYPMVKYLADHGLSLPRPDPAQPWRQEGGQPPLYYIAAAVLTGWIDTGDMDYVRRVNPHADIGVIRPDGNANMMVHRVNAEAFPPRGTVLAAQMARLFSVVLGLGTVLVTYALAREIFPNWPLVWLGAAALNAFLPMFLFISGSVNNDNLSNLLGNGLTLLIVRLLKTPNPRLRHYVVIGLAAGAGLLSKLNIGFLIPLVALALLVVSVRRRDWRPVVVGGAISGGLTIAIAGWWYWRNWQLYGDPTGLNAFLDTVGRRLIPANAAQLWAERHSFTRSYWGFFGGMNVEMPEAVYLAFNIIGGLALVSALVFILLVVLRRLRLTGDDPRCMVLLPAAITVAWPIITFLSYLRWTAETPASQGRLIFGALSCISLWMAVGLLWPLPRRLRPAVMGGVGAFFAITAVLAPFLVIAPAYARPAPIMPGEARAVFGEPGDGGAVALSQARVLTETVQPEGYARLEADFQIEAPLSRDWSLFVHLTNADGVIISQRDVYPGGGRLATSDLAAGFAWHNPIAVRVPPGAAAPQTLVVNVGWYHLPTGERLTLEDGAETVTLGQVQLMPRRAEVEVPNPLRVNFDDQIELVGYVLSDFTPASGDNVTLTLYWRALRPIDENYTVFAHIIDPRTFTIYAGNNSWPAEGGAPTSTWEPGVIVEDRRVLPLREDTPPDIYELEVGLYTARPDGSFPRLRILTADGGMADDYFYLNRVRVVAAEDTP